MKARLLDHKKCIDWVLVQKKSDKNKPLHRSMSCRHFTLICCHSSHLFKESFRSLERSFFDKTLFFIGINEVFNISLCVCALYKPQNNYLTKTHYELNNLFTLLGSGSEWQKTRYNF